MRATIRFTPLSNKHPQEIPATLEARQKWMNENKKMLGNYKYAVMQEVFKYTNQDHFKSGKADECRYTAVNNIFDNLLVLNSAQFLRFVVTTSNREEKNTWSFKTCSFSRIGKAAKQQQSKMSRDTSNEFLIVAMLGLVMSFFANSPTITGPTLMVSVFALFAAASSSHLITGDPDLFMLLHNFSQRIHAQDAGRTLLNLADKSVGLLVNAANHLERRLPAPPQRQLLQTDGAEEHKSEATITL